MGKTRHFARNCAHSALTEKTLQPVHSCMLARENEHLKGEVLTNITEKHPGIFTALWDVVVIGHLKNGTHSSTEFRARWHLVLSQVVESTDDKQTAQCPRNSSCAKCLLRLLSRECASQILVTSLARVRSRLGSAMRPRRKGFFAERGIALSCWRESALCSRSYHARESRTSAPSRCSWSPLAM